MFDPFKICNGGITVLCLMVLGCAAGPVEKDLVNYINQDVMGISRVETRALARYQSVSGTRYVSDEQLLEVLQKEVIPTYSGLVKALDRIEPRTEPVQHLHALYRQSSAARLKAFELAMTGIRYQDSTLIRAANQMMAAGDNDMERWQQALDQLLKAHKIKSYQPLYKSQLIKAVPE